MRILQVCSAEGRGGGERHVADLAQALTQRGHEVHLAVRPGSYLRSMLRDCSVIWHDVPLRNAADIFSATRLKKIIRHHNIDIVHAHVARDYTVCGHATRHTTASFFITRHHYSPIRSNPLYTRAISHVSKLIGVSQYVASQLRTSFPSLRERVIVIPNWIDISKCGNVSREQSRKKLEISKRLAVGIAGQITPLKRQDWLVRAALEILREAKQPDLEFLIIGEAQPDDFDYAERLRQMIHQSASSQQIRFTGFVENLAAYLSAMDVMVVPSENEAFSLSLVESMAAQCAVVAANTGAVSEIVEQEKSGLLFEADSYQQMKSALQRLLEDAALRASLGRHAALDVRARFNREQIIPAIETLYQHSTSKLFLL
jgi:glycosyltransferase involved in cell wall biosynthesis